MSITESTTTRPHRVQAQAAPAVLDLGGAYETTRLSPLWHSDATLSAVFTTLAEELPMHPQAYRTAVLVVQRARELAHEEAQEAGEDVAEQWAPQPAAILEDLLDDADAWMATRVDLDAPVDDDEHQPVGAAFAAHDVDLTIVRGQVGEDVTYLVLDGS